MQKRMQVLISMIVVVSGSVMVQARAPRAVDALRADRAATRTAPWAVPSQTETQIMAYVPHPGSQLEGSVPVMGVFGVDDPGRRRRRQSERISNWPKGLDGAGSYHTDGPPLIYFKTHQKRGRQERRHATDQHE